MKLRWIESSPNTFTSLNNEYAVRFVSARLWRVRDIHGNQVAVATSAPLAKRAAQEHHDGPGAGSLGARMDDFQWRKLDVG